MWDEMKDSKIKESFFFLVKRLFYLKKFILLIYRGKESTLRLVCSFSTRNSINLIIGE